MARQTNPIIIRLGLQNAFWHFKYFTKKPEENSIYVYQNIQLKNYFHEILTRLGLFFHNITIIKNYNTLKLLISYFVTNKLVVLTRSDRKTYRFKFRRAEIKGIISCKKSIILKKSLTRKIVQRTSFVGQILKSLTLFKKFDTHVFLKFKQINKNKTTGFTKNEKLELKQKFLFLRRFYKKSFFKGITNSLLILAKFTHCAELFLNIISQELLVTKRHSTIIFFLKLTILLLKSAHFYKIDGVKLSLKGKLSKSGRSAKNEFNFGIVPTQVFFSKLTYAQKTVFLKNGTIGLKTWVNEKF